MPEKKGYKGKTGGIDVLILCGGFGRRLRSVLSDKPKPMAEIAGRPFLDILIDYVSGFGFKRFILCLGYKGGVIKRHYKKKEASVEILFSQENKPLGTAGALKNAKRFIKSEPFLVMNGDSLCRFDLTKFIDFYFKKKASCALAVTKVKSGISRDYGAVRLADGARVVQFREKNKTGIGSVVNAGIYIFGNRIFPLIPNGKIFSLEHDLLPKIVSSRFYGYVVDGNLIDIGTPQRYERAKQVIGKI